METNSLNVFKGESGAIFFEATVGLAFLLAMISWTVNLGANIWETSLFLDTSRALARAEVYNCGQQTYSGAAASFLDSVSLNNNSTRGRNNWDINQNENITYSYGSVTLNDGLLESESIGAPGGSGNYYSFSQPTDLPASGVGLNFRTISIANTSTYCRFCSGYFSAISTVTINARAVFPRSNSC